MKKISDNSNNRRKFLSLGLLGGAGLLSQKAAAMMPIEPEAEKVKMLTPDGKLVEVDQRVLDQVAEKTKAANTDIFDWATTQYKTGK
jgi:hypothetical protein